MQMKLWGSILLKQARESTKETQTGAHKSLKKYRRKPQKHRRHSLKNSLKKASL